MGDNTGRSCVSNTLQSGCGKYHPDMVGHDSGKPEGGTRWVVRCSRVAHVVFYTDYCIFGSRDPDCLQHSMSVLVSPFLWYGIAANVSNSRLMTCKTGAFRLGISVDTGDINCMGLGDSYHMRLRQRIPCLECGVELSAGIGDVSRNVIP